MGFLAPLMLFGLFAVSIPPIIHLLNRRRFETVDWGAMQFLKISETTRRRLLIEEILLMALRMLLIAVMVLVLTGPFWEGLLLAGSKPNRDVVLVFDGSASMGYTGTTPTPHEAAKEWALDFMNDLQAGDTVAVLVAKQQVVPLLEATHDLERARTVIRQLPEPSGGCDLPRALEAAYKVHKETSQRAQRDIIVLGDGMRQGWADDKTLLGWGMLADKLRGQKDGIQPSVWVVNLSPLKPLQKDELPPPNWSLGPIRSARTVVARNREVIFKTNLVLIGQKQYRPPHDLRIEVDGQPVQDPPKPPESATLDNGQVPFSFSRKFTTPGSHLVSVIVEPDPPASQRPPGYVIKDQLPADNRQDYAIEVVSALPVLLVDGDARPQSPSELRPRERGTDFLRDALAPKRDTTPVVLARVVPIQEFRPELLKQDVGKDKGTRPRVLILSNIAQLNHDQEEAITDFLAGGGGVLVTLGERVEGKYYNDNLYRSGQGWLPAHLEEPVGDETETAKAVSPQPSSFFHPALELFRDEKIEGLAGVRVPRYWKVTMPGRNSSALAVARFSNNAPFFVERPYQAGRVLLCTVPLDNSWRTNLPEKLAFAPLAHELVYYLAGARAARHNVEPGQPLRFQPAGDERPDKLIIRPPQGEPKTENVISWPFDFRDTRYTGVYRMDLDGRTTYFVVQPDPAESVLAPATEQEREKVAKLVPLKYENDRGNLSIALVASSHHQELWLWFLIGVVVLLCGEVWLTRRIALNR
jgi:von Willebrand factor type A domain/Aerotolerance regulator N-terminal